MDPDKIADKIVDKLKVKKFMAVAALKDTSKVRGQCMIYHEGYAVELLEKIQKISPDSSEVHQLLGEGYESEYEVRRALALGDKDMKKAREILDAQAQATSEETKE